QPLAASSAPAVAALPVFSASVPDTETDLAQPALPSIETRPMPRAAPLAGWGRLYASVCVFLI
ncbi:MAG TPA: hypothetical protein VNB06_13005, partial [Thermoanaerobaculia bacterium]|nr:hypothetical protein [Thermoanaerobaculia bacterium]